MIRSNRRTAEATVKITNRTANLAGCMAVLAGVLTASLAASGCDSSSAGSRSDATSSQAPREVPQPILDEKDSPFRVRLSWTMPDGAAVDGFEITRDDNVIVRLPGTATGYLDRDVLPRSVHTYSVQATSGDRHSQPVLVVARLSDPPLATARLEGYFDVRLKVTSSSGYGNNPPGTTTAGWHFKPLCPQGACDAIWVDNGAKSVHARATRHGARYHISASGYYFVTCNGAHATTSLDITFRVTKARVRGHEWIASRVQGTYQQSEAAQLGCGSSQANATVRGRAVS
jgi:hypothetical protein